MKKSPLELRLRFPQSGERQSGEHPPDPLIPLFRLPLPHLHCKNRRDPGLTRISVRRRHSQTRPRRRLPTQW